MPIRTPLTIVAVLVVVLGASVLLAPGHKARSGAGGARAAISARAQVERIAARVEALRGLRFRHLPNVRVVTPATARSEGLADLRRSEPAAGQAADAELLELLGLLPRGSSLLRIASSIYGEQVAGYYDPRTKRLAVVAAGRAGTARGPLAEITLAHELTHALEDQRFGLAETGGGTDDAASARQALVEGTATEVMTLYTQRYLRSAETLAGAVSGLSQGESSEPLPPYVEKSLLFPYIAGQQFVEALRRLGGSWTLVNLALAGRSPRSTAQIIHPLAWMRRRRPLAVHVPGASALGAGWRGSAAGGLGEFDTDQLLALASGQFAAGEAAAGWGGGRYALFRRGARTAGGCGSPCAARDALVLRWRWQTAGDGRQFAAAARRYVARRRSAVAGIALRTGARAATIAFAPTQAQAQALAAAR